MKASTFEPLPSIDALDHALGAPSARVTLVEYVDFECPSCKQAAPVVKLLLTRFHANLGVLCRHFPLEEVHPHALAAALAAEAAGAQAKFWPMHDLLFAKQRSLSPTSLRTWAETLGLDLQRFDTDRADPRRLARIRQQMEGARLSGVRATPTFFVNGAIQDVSFGYAALAQRIERALQG